LGDLNPGNPVTSVLLEVGSRYCVGRPKPSQALSLLILSSQENFGRRWRSKRQIRRCPRSRRRHRILPIFPQMPITPLLRTSPSSG